MMTANMTNPALEAEQEAMLNTTGAMFMVLEQRRLPVVGIDFGQCQLIEDGKEWRVVWFDASDKFHDSFIRVEELYTDEEKVAKLQERLDRRYEQIDRLQDDLNEYTYTAQCKMSQLDEEIESIQNEIKLLRCGSFDRMHGIT